MRLSKPIRDNLFFLIAETLTQLNDLQVLLETASGTLARRTLDRRGYAYNLKMRIHDGCLSGARRMKGRTGPELFPLRAAEVTASELERLVNLAFDAADQVAMAKQPRTFKSLGSLKILDPVIAGVQMIAEAIEEDVAKRALDIGKQARRTGKSYDGFHRRHARALLKRKQPAEGIAVVLVAERVKEMGAALLEISEAIISANLGHPLDLERYHFLETAFDDLGLEDPDVATIAETKSGSLIAGIGSDEKDSYRAIIKDGAKEKLKEEWESVESWHEVFPGLAPRILSYRKKGDNASLLIEHLSGETFEQILLTESDELLDLALKHLTKTLRAVWNETRKNKSLPAKHMAQLRKRLPSVAKIHSDIDRGGSRLGSAKIPSLEHLISQAEKLEATIEPPFSVYIHGDFNIDNIIFDPAEKKIRFIDLHRSAYSDYVQDVAVFMVSNYRLQVLDRQTRNRIMRVASSFYDFANEFADRQADKTFPIRLSLGLARSFITSTRFILDRTLAEGMTMRGIYILERVIAHDMKKPQDLRLPIRELFQS